MTKKQFFWNRCPPPSPLSPEDKKWALFILPPLLIRSSFKDRYSLDETCGHFHDKRTWLCYMYPFSSFWVKQQIYCYNIKYGENHGVHRHLQKLIQTNIPKINPRSLATSYRAIVRTYSAWHKVLLFSFPYFNPGNQYCIDCKRRKKVVIFILKRRARISHTQFKNKTKMTELQTLIRFPSD